MENILLGLAVLACPLGMVACMWFMGKTMKGGESGATPEGASSVDELRQEQQRLSAEIERLESSNADIRRTAVQ